MKKRQQNGFTLYELLITFLIVGVVLALWAVMSQLVYPATQNIFRSRRAFAGCGPETHGPSPMVPAN